MLHLRKVDSLRVLRHGSEVGDGGVEDVRDAQGAEAGTQVQVRGHVELRDRQVHDQVLAVGPFFPLAAHQKELHDLGVLQQLLRRDALVRQEELHRAAVIIQGLRDRGEALAPKIGAAVSGPVQEVTGQIPRQAVEHLGRGVALQKLMLPPGPEINSGGQGQNRTRVHA